MKTGFRPLSKIQKAKLAQLARESFETLYKNGLIDAPGDSKSVQFTNWRHVEQQEAVGRSSLTKCVQKDYLPLLAHFQSLIGQDDEAFKTHIKNQPVNDKADPSDTQEARDQVIKRIEQELDGSRFTLGYVRSIARNQYGTTKIENLTKEQLTQLLMTAKKRVATAS